jgi:tetratricopeptide (TPR) repeat protein
LESAGRDEEALQHYRAAQASNDHDYVAHYDIGSYLLRHGKAEDAILEFQLALRDAPGQQAIKVILNATGLAYSTLGNYSEAERAYDAALRYDPLYYISLMGRGELFYRQGKYRQAADDYARASAVEPNPLVYLWWGEALEADGQAPAALSAYGEALHLAPDLEEAKARINSLRGKR